MSEVVWVTGATSGIGEACVAPFLAAGHRVVAVGRRADRLDALQEKFAKESERLSTIRADVRDAAALDTALENVAAAFRQSTILVANAGIARGLAKAQEASLDDWDTMLATNVRAVIALVRRVLPGMVEARRGHIVFVGSVAGSHAYVGGNVYGATKAFIAQFAENLRSDLHGTGVRVTTIEPGMVETEFSTARFDGDEARAKAVYAGMEPLTAADVADTIVWAATRPAHVNISKIELYPTAQSLAGFQVART
jgi:NADP-dependent 3-hydroxy acid dehydrogenase YdfG